MVCSLENKTDIYKTFLEKPFNCLRFFLVWLCFDFFLFLLLLFIGFGIAWNRVRCLQRTRSLNTQWIKAKDKRSRKGKKAEKCSLNWKWQQNNIFTSHFSFSFPSVFSKKSLPLYENFSFLILMFYIYRLYKILSKIILHQIDERTTQVNTFDAFIYSYIQFCFYFVCRFILGVLCWTSCALFLAVSLSVMFYGRVTGFDLVWWSRWWQRWCTKLVRHRKNNTK